MTSFLDLSKKTKEEIKKLKKPLSAYQYYIKDMREKWNNLNDAEKEKYLFQAQQDNQRYEKEKMEIKEICDTLIVEQYSRILVNPVTGRKFPYSAEYNDQSKTIKLRVFKT